LRIRLRRHDGIVAVQPLLGLVVDIKAGLQSDRDRLLLAGFFGRGARFDLNQRLATHRGRRLVLRKGCGRVQDRDERQHNSHVNNSRFSTNPRRGLGLNPNGRPGRPFIPVSLVLPRSPPWRNQLANLSDPITQDAKIELIARDDARALELIRHDAAHVLAEAVQSLWPGTQVTIGPVIENGFYYDFFRNEPFTPEDFAAIEKKMREIIARDKPFTKEVWTREQAKQVFRDNGEMFKVELVDAIPADQTIKI